MLGIEIDGKASASFVRLLWVVSLFAMALAVYLAATGVPVKYGKGNILQLGSSSSIVGDEVEAFIEDGEIVEVEVNMADKVFAPDTKCQVGQVRPYYNSGQAAICACFKESTELNGVKYGQGWFCWN